MRVPLGNVDASWLRMDEPANRMVVTGVLVFDAPVEVARLRQLIEDRLVPFDRFRQRAVPPLAGIGVPSWEEDPDFSLDHHLLVAEPAGPGEEAGEAGLQAYVSGLLSRPFEPRRPLWEFHFVPRYERGSALVVRIHHCIGDGLALTHVLLSLADGHALPSPRPAAPRPQGLSEALRSTLARTARTVQLTRGLLSRELSALLADPDRARRAGALAGRHLGSLARLLLLPPDPLTSLKGPLTPEKRVAWSKGFELEDFKAVAHATGSTINDILMAALAGGLRRYLLELGEVPRDLDVRGVVPVNLRRPEDAHLLGNRFGLVFLSLPLGAGDAHERLVLVRARMREIKRSTEAPAIFELLWALGAAPRRVFDLALNIFASKATAVVTNVAGPRDPIVIAGSKLRQAMFWVPSAGHLGLGVSLLSYAGQVWLGVQSDLGLIPDPARILRGFEEEVAALSALARPTPASPAPPEAEPLSTPAAEAAPTPHLAPGAEPTPTPPPARKRRPRARKASPVPEEPG